MPWTTNEKHGVHIEVMLALFAHLFAGRDEFQYRRQ